MKGKFITFEGCEGVGKSTQIKWLKEYLHRKNIACVFTREPGGSIIAESIRSIILDSKHSNMSDICEAMLYSAARNQHIKDIIEPALNSGKHVICDRYIDSTYAYQGIARGLGSDFINSLNSLAVAGYMPDVTIFLDLPPRQAFMRKGGRDKSDRLELMDISFHEKVYEGYLELYKKYPERIVRIDARHEKPITHNKILQAINKALEIR